MADPPTSPEYPLPLSSCCGIAAAVDIAPSLCKNRAKMVQQHELRQAHVKPVALGHLGITGTGAYETKPSAMLGTSKQQSRHGDLFPSFQET